MPHDHSELIEGLGGSEGVLNLLRQPGRLLSLSAVRQWRYRGIPHRYRPAIVKEARRAKLSVPDGFLNP